MIVSICVSSAYADDVKADYRVVPLPENIKILGNKPFLLNASTNIVYANGDSLLQRNATFLAEYVKKSVGLSLVVKSHSSNSWSACALKKRQDTTPLESIKCST